LMADFASKRSCLSDQATDNGRLIRMAYDS
jgi:hypothetical protein